MSLRDLPSVDALVRSLRSGLPRPLVTSAARAAIDEARQRRSTGDEADADEIAARHLDQLAASRPRSVVNATGVLLHTNLGRAPLAPEAARAAEVAARSYGNLEFDLASGSRGERAAYARELIRALTGAEASLIVNNNAAGLFLTLSALATARSVPVSRGELIEIGGSYRLPDLMGASGAHMIEVGTTNRTHLTDYAEAITPETALLLKVHPSNYRVVGFAESVEITALAELARQRALPVVFDVGSGLIDENVPWLQGAPPAWLADEPGVRQALDSGADLVLFSGDKLLGGPQAGILVGRADLIDRLAEHPAARAVRCDGPTLAALTATLEMYAAGRGAEIPFWAMATEPYDRLQARLARLRDEVAAVGEIRPGSSVLGAGSVPGAKVPSPVLAVSDPPSDLLWRRLLMGEPPVVSRRVAGEVVIDLRAVPTDQDGHLAEALRAACRS